MITTEDIQLSKMSYTDKDFASLYPDLLDLAKQLTNKWDPSLSNESDPGVVLLKEAAFVSDHNNYNIDKNVLENFLPSATQEESVQNIVAMNGYNPRYYVSAVGSVNVSYKLSDDTTTFSAFNLPAFTLQISDDNGTVYTQLDNLSISQEDVSSKCNFIQGTLNNLEVNGSTTILLDNLDENKRLYFPIQQVAQNGIYIKNDGDSILNLWESTDYLQTQPLRSKVYKVGYDSQKSLPYVEFPSDISNIIGRGLNISYIVSSGLNGNIAANKLNKVVSPATIAITDDYSIVADNFTISNPNAILNGKDPETIDEMYQSFQKIVGTFDTLVTCRDYTNAVNTLTDNLTRDKLVSNSVVTDINTDYNNAFKVVTYDENGPYFETLSVCRGVNKFRFVTDPSAEGYEPVKGDIKFNSNRFEVYDGAGNWSTITSISYDEFVSATEAMSQYDLCLYALKAFSMADYDDYKPALALNNSYEPIKDTVVETIKTKLKDYKCISHTFKDNKTGDIIYFKNYVPLYVTITPYAKVTKEIRNDIIKNVYRVISEKFNASKLQFGYELNYDDVYDTLLMADDRIKNIRLEDFDYRPVAVIKETDGYSEVDINDSDLLLTLVSKNVMAGRVCLFNFAESESFTYKFGEVESTEYKDTAEISTKAEIHVNTTGNGRISSSSSISTETNVFDNIEDVDTIALRLIQNPDTEALPPTTITIQTLETSDIPIGMILNIYSRFDNPEYDPEDPTSKEYIFRLISTYKPSDVTSYSVYNATSNTIILTFPAQTEEDYTTVASDGIELISSTIVSSASNVDKLLSDYVLNPNEYVQVAYPNYYSDVIYPAYVAYRYEGTKTIAADTDTKLSASDKLILCYMKDDKTTMHTYSSGEIIRANFEIEPFTDNTPGTRNKKGTDQNGNKIDASFLTIAADEQIEHRELLKTEITGSAIPCYWIKNNSSNTLFESGKNEVILNNGEYFVYSNPSKDGMVIMGPGSKLTKSQNDTSDWTIGSSISIKSISENGFTTSIDWKTKDFSNDKTFTITEMNIFNFGESDRISLLEGNLETIGDEAEPVIDNNWRTFDGSIFYVLTDGTTGTLAKIDDKYLIRSRLDINATNGSQELYFTGDSETCISKQVVTIKNSSSETSVTIESTDDKKVTFGINKNVSLVGGDGVNLSDYSEDIINTKSYQKADVVYYKVKYAELSDEDTFNTNQYRKVGTKYIKLSSGDVTTYTEEFETYANYKANPLLPRLYNKLNDYDEEILKPADNYYAVSLSNEGYIDMPLHFLRDYGDEPGALLDTYNHYIIPIYYNNNEDESASQIKVEVIGPTGGHTYVVNEVGESTASSSFSTSGNNMYLIEINPENSEQLVGVVSEDVTFKISIEAGSNASIKVYNPAIHTGINKKLNVPFEYSSVINKIRELIANSTKNNIKPYYIYKPENSLAIQDEDFKNPTILWDANNVINNISIPQIDISDSDIDITKSMRNY